MNEWIPPFGVGPVRYVGITLLSALLRQVPGFILREEEEDQSSILRMFLNGPGSALLFCLLRGLLIKTTYSTRSPSLLHKKAV